MLQADGLGNSNFFLGAESLPEDNPLDLCIDLERFYAILDEDSDPPPRPSPASPEDFSSKHCFGHESSTVAAAVIDEKPSQTHQDIQGSEWAVPEDARLLGSSPSALSVSDTGMGMGMGLGLGLGLLFDSPENLENFNQIYYAELELDHRKSHPSPENVNKFSPISCAVSTTSDWQTHTSPQHDTSRDSFGGPITARMSINTGNEYIHNDPIYWGSTVKVASKAANYFSEDSTDASNLIHSYCKKEETDTSNLIHSYCKKEEEFKLVGDESQFENEASHSTRDTKFALLPSNSIEERTGSSNLPFMGVSGWTSSNIILANGTAVTSLKNSPYQDECESSQVISEDTLMREASDCCLQTPFNAAAAAAADAPYINSTLARSLPGTGFYQMLPLNGGKWDVPPMSLSCTKVGSSVRGERPLSSSTPVSSLDVPVIDTDISISDIQYTGMRNFQDANFNCKGNGGLFMSQPVSFISNRNSSSFDGDVVAGHELGDLGFESLMSKSKQRLICMEEERQKVQVFGSHATGQYHPSSRGNDDTVNQENSTSVSGSWDDDDSDICILEEISKPRRHPHRITSIPHGKSLAISQCSSNRGSLPLDLSEIVGIRPRTKDERLTFQVALQDLSLTNSEANPPDGVLAVPLLRHQKIALSWMVQKETASVNCSGGILADDQGLGKTISTIALILMERAPSSKPNSKPVQQHSAFETFDLDGDDHDVAREPAETTREQVAGGSGRILSNSNGRDPVKRENATATFTAGKGRPAAGTLVVCPTSVLRQWADELHSKVTSKANLSVLVYHGSNRTKDPEELAKYDVVLTTYSIVSMEVPKQPLVDQDEKGGKSETHHHDSTVGPSTGRKRKTPSGSNSNKKSQRKGTDGEILECFAARPLSRVGWFRVVLDEAQSIKNHRTQVARACWGLRAKRRWCLSGTPIQNAIDDLYSYFRFLRYDPYAIYKSFCSTLKVPISKNPNNGYKKLQAVLKTIMLRRTKASLIDGEPIINLPPKTISLKKVDFSLEEREFYSRLEADSRAQFKVYAAAGTVKQNYVNILLMLLRLRQACDHPLLVKGYDSNSLWRSSVEMAKKLPKETLNHLLNCLEACCAICSLCNDPPEDAVVTICGHVFCNQCICEHLTGDDSLCPAAHCKTHLSVTSVFSRVTLNHSLCNQPDQDFDSSCGQLVQAPNLCREIPSESSKIKAALEILQSMTTPRSIQQNQAVAVDASGPECTSGSSSSNLQVAEKAIVFSQWTRMLDLLEVPLRSSSIQFRRLDGTMSVLARDKAVKEFNTLPEVSVMIMSLKAASLGLNMVAACHVLLLDLWWNPTTEDQAIDRAHRIGQTRPVRVSRLTVKDTVEDRILALQEKKRQMVSSAFGEDDNGSRQTRLTVEDLQYLFMA